MNQNQTSTNPEFLAFDSEQQSCHIRMYQVLT